MEKPVLVQCITNSVSMNDCANGLLAIGASPTMAHHYNEVQEVQHGCNALVCNLGATDDYDAMLIAAKEASAQKHPIVIDPVGVGGSSFRREFFKQLVEAGNITCVRGNYSEILTLAKGTSTTVGVDAYVPALEEKFATEGKDGLVATVQEAAMLLAKRLECIVVASGEIDVITDGEKIAHLTVGDPMMSRVTGTGCMSSAILGGYLAMQGATFETVVSCCEKIGLCGQEAARQAREEDAGTMTFHMKFIDLLSK